MTESFLDRSKWKSHIQLTNREDHEEAPGHLTNVGKGVEDSEKEEVVVFAFGKDSKLKNKTWMEIKEGEGDSTRNIVELGCNNTRIDEGRRLELILGQSGTRRMIER